MLQGKLAYGGRIKFNDGGPFDPLELGNQVNYLGDTENSIANSLYGNYGNTYSGPPTQNQPAYPTQGNFQVPYGTKTSTYATMPPLLPQKDFEVPYGSTPSPYTTMPPLLPAEDQNWHPPMFPPTDNEYPPVPPPFVPPFAPPPPAETPPGWHPPMSLPDDSNKPRNPEDTNTNYFNEKLTTGEKVASFIPAAAQAFSLIGGPEKTTYAQLNPRYVDYETQRTGIRKESAAAKLQAMKNIRNIAGNSGRALSNMVAANTGIYDATGSQLNKSYGDEYNTNTGIYNQTNQANVGIQNAQNDANAANRAKYRDQMLAAVVNASSAYKGIKKDDRAYSSNNIYNNAVVNNMGTGEYEEYIDPITKLPMTRLRPIKTSID